MSIIDMDTAQAPGRENEMIDTDCSNTPADSIASTPINNGARTPNSLSPAPSSAQRPEMLRPRASQHPSWSGLILRRPGQDDSTFTPPKVEWLQGTWHFTHSTLPIWEDKRNVKITYDVQKADKPGGKERLDDIVEYQEGNSDKVKTVRGRNIEKKDHDAGGWDWRGKGIIKVAFSHWDILGWGVDPVQKGQQVPGENKWMVTYFIKTVFTPAAVDIYSQSPAGLSPQLVEEIKSALKRTNDPDITRLVDQLYECRQDAMERP